MYPRATFSVLKVSYEPIRHSRWSGCYSQDEIDQFQILSGNHHERSEMTELDLCCHAGEPHIYSVLVGPVVQGRDGSLSIQQLAIESNEWFFSLERYCSKM